MPSENNNAPIQPIPVSDIPKAETATTTDNNLKRKVATAGKNRSHGSILVAGLALFVAIIAIAETAVFWNQLNHWHRKSMHRETKLTAAMEENNANLAQFSQNLQNVQASLNQQQTQLNDNQTISRYLLERTQANRSYWVIMEVQQLLELANLRLQYGHDLAGALLLIHGADQQLHAVADADLLRLRQALSNDVAALEAVPKVDTAGILARITTLSNRLDQLSLATAQAPSTATISEHHHHNSKWKTAWQHSLDSLQKLVVIRYHNEPIEPLLPIEQSQYLLQKMQLRLEQAQWAVLHNNNPIYLTSLQQVSDWIQHYYANSQTTTIKTLEELAQLQKINIDPPLPNLATTLTLVKQLSQKPPSPTVMPAKTNKAMPNAKALTPVTNATENKPVEAPGTATVVPAAQGSKP